MHTDYLFYLIVKNTFFKDLPEDENTLPAGTVVVVRADDEEGIKRMEKAVDNLLARRLDKMVTLPESIKLEDLTKEELVKLGTNRGLDLNPRDRKADLIKQIEEFSK